MIKILFIASESIPFDNSSDIADMTGYLPRYLDKRYYDCRIIIPLYPYMSSQYAIDKIEGYYLSYNDILRYVNIYKLVKQDIIYYFIDIYQHSTEKDTNEKYDLFSIAALSSLPILGYKPDIIHCIGLKVSYIPQYIKNRFSKGIFYKNIKTILTISNIYDQEKISKYDMIYADAMTSIGSIEDSDISYIINGIEHMSYNPSTDEHIYEQYNICSYKKKKYINKRSLQRELGLKIDKSLFTVGMMIEQVRDNGIEFIKDIIEDIAKNCSELVISGDIDEDSYRQLMSYKDKYPDKISIIMKSNIDMDHKIYASCDVLLILSGCTIYPYRKIISMRYGTIPIAISDHKRCDTIEPYNQSDNTGTGFIFDNYKLDDILYSLDFARNIYFGNKRAWNKMIERDMKERFAWDDTAKEYQKIYERITR